jgi:hypothetical protein
MSSPENQTAPEVETPGPNNEDSGGASIPPAAAKRKPRPRREVLARLEYRARCAVTDIVEPLLAVLNKHGRSLGIYEMNGRFVEPIHGYNGGLTFQELTGPVLVSKLGRNVEIGILSKDGFQVRDCPARVCDAILRRSHECPALSIRRVSRTPMWDPAKQQLLSGNGPRGDVWIKAPAIELPEPCGKAEALAALERIRKEALGEFCFPTKLYESAAVGALMFAAFRTSFRTPAIAISKPSFGAGASTFTDLITTVLCGETMAKFAASSEEDITKKVESSLQMAAPAIIFDNIKSGAAGFNSEVVAQVITEESYGVRPFGRNDTIVPAACNSLVIFNGENLKLNGDLVRRSFAIRLDPQMENPEYRDFARPELISEMRNGGRTQLLKDLYTIFVAYIRSGERVKVRSLAGFSRAQGIWASLVWCGLPDPIATQDLLRSEAPTKQKLRRVHAAWQVLRPGSTAIRLRDLVAATETSNPADTEEIRDARADLSAVIMELKQNPKADSTHTLGNFLNSQVDQCVGRWKLEKTPPSHGVAKWRWRNLDDDGDNVPQADELTREFDAHEDAQTAKAGNGKVHAAPTVDDRAAFFEKELPVPPKTAGELAAEFLAPSEIEALKEIEAASDDRLQWAKPSLSADGIVEIRKRAKAARQRLEAA